MDYNEVFAAITQMKNSGVDLNTVMAATQSLLDTGKTPLGLNQWKLTDKPRMEEFNKDNRIIDEQLSKKANQTTWHNLELINGTVHSEYPLKYCRIGNLVCMQGVPSWEEEKTLPVVFAQLPENFCPPSHIGKMVPLRGTNNLGAYCRIGIDPKGAVTCFYCSIYDSLKGSTAPDMSIVFPVTE